jgi:beta-galactosidase
MVRLWSWEAFAHGAAVVSFFRWRQAPFAQEQMHAGLLRPDSTEAEAWPEIALLAAELQAIALPSPTRSPVAMIVDIEAQYLSEIERQGRGYDYTAILHGWYGVLRRLGVDVDFVAPGADLTGYRLVLAPALVMPDSLAVERLADAQALVVLGPRSGAKTADVTIPEGLPPGLLRPLMPIRILSVETLRPDCPGGLEYNGASFASHSWRERLDIADADVLARYEDGSAALVRHGRVHYLATLADDAFLMAFFTSLCAEADIAVMPLAGALRLRRRGDLTFAINYGADSATAPAPEGAVFVLGGRQIDPRDLAIWRHG